MLKHTLLASAALLLAMGTAQAGNSVSVSQSGGSSNEVFISQSSSGGVNESFVKQFSSGSNSLKVDQKGGKNISKSIQKGQTNDVKVKQAGPNNLAAAIQKGDKNTGSIVMKDEGKVVKKDVWAKEHGNVDKKVAWVRPGSEPKKPDPKDVKKVPHTPEVEKPKPADPKVVPVKDPKKPEAKKPEAKKPDPVKVTPVKVVPVKVVPVKVVDVKKVEKPKTETEKVKAPPKEKKPESTNKVTTSQSGGSTSSVKIGQSGANNEANAQQTGPGRKIGNIAQTDTATGKTQTKAWDKTGPTPTNQTLTTPPKK